MYQAHKFAALHFFVAVIKHVNIWGSYLESGALFSKTLSVLPCSSITPTPPSLIKENLSLRWIPFSCSAWLQFNSSGTILASFLTANDVFVWQTHSTQSGGGECQKRKEATRPLGGDGNIANSCSNKIYHILGNKSIRRGWQHHPLLQLEKEWDLTILTFILCCCVQSIKWSYKQWFSWLWIVDSFLHLAKILFELKKP